MQEEMEQAELVALQQVGGNGGTNDGNGNGNNGNGGSGGNGTNHNGLNTAMAPFDHETHSHQQQQMMQQFSSSLRTDIDAMRASFVESQTRQNELLLAALAEQSAHIRRLEAVVTRLTVGGGGGGDGALVAVEAAETGVQL